MKKCFANVILLGVVAIVAIGGYIAWNHKITTTPLWKTYTSTNQSFTFGYPYVCGEPQTTQLSTRVMMQFGNCFSVTTGFYYDQMQGRNATVLEVVNGYKNSTLKT